MKRLWFLSVILALFILPSCLKEEIYVQNQPGKDGLNGLNAFIEYVGIVLPSDLYPDGAVEVVSWTDGLTSSGERNKDFVNMEFDEGEFGMTFYMPLIAGPQGVPGLPGSPGTDGADGTSVILTQIDDVWYLCDDENCVEAQGPAGETGPQGPAGPQGETGPIYIPEFYTIVTEIPVTPDFPGGGQAVAFFDGQNYIGGWYIKWGWQGEQGEPGVGIPGEPGPPGEPGEASNLSGFRMETSESCENGGYTLIFELVEGNEISMTICNGEDSEIDYCVCSSYTPFCESNSVIWYNTLFFNETFSDSNLPSGFQSDANLYDFLSGYLVVKNDQYTDNPVDMLSYDFQALYLTKVSVDVAEYSDVYEKYIQLVLIDIDGNEIPLDTFEITADWTDMENLVWNVEPNAVITNIVLRFTDTVPDVLQGGDPHHNHRKVVIDNLYVKGAAVECAESCNN